MDHNRASNLSPRENTTWDDAHDESVASLLLQEIDFLTLASPTVSTDDHDYTSPSDQQLDPCSDISTTTSSNSTERQITDASGSPGDSCSWEDSLVTFSGDDASLCDGLSDDFDLLSYAEDGCNDCLLQQNEAAEDFGISDKSELDELLSCNDLLETESQFTQIKPRPRAVSQQCGQPDNSDSSSPTSGDPTAAVSLKKQPRRDADEPKRPKNGFIRYSIKHRAELLKKYPYKDNRTISKLLGIRWKKMTAEEKQPYVEEFNNDIHEIRSQNPKWRYAPAKRSAEELIDPMNKRLRPREKIRSKLLKRLDSEWDWDFSPDDSSQGSWDGRQSPLQKSANTWRQCDACSQWRPLSGHIDAEDLPQTWDSRSTEPWIKQVLLHEPRQSVQQVCDTGRSISPATQPDPGAACPSQPVCPGVPSLACPASPAASFRQSSDAGCHRQHHSHFATLAASSSTPQPLCNSSGFIVNTTATLQL